MDRVLRGAGAGLRGAALRPGRCTARHRVPRRLGHRVQPQRGQPVRVPHHHGHVPGAPPLPAGGADGGHHHRADRPRGVHRGRRRRHRAPDVGVLHLRRLPALDRLAAAQGRRRGRGVRAGRRGPPDPPPQRGAGLRRQPTAHHRGRPAHVHPHGGRVHHDRPDGRDVRGGLHPGDLRPHPELVHRPDRQYLRPHGPAPAGPTTPRSARRGSGRRRATG